jgi:Fe-S cluster assembly protein SufD
VRAIEIVHVTASAAAASVYHRALVDVGPEAEVRFVESHRGPEASACQVNSVIELVVGDGARVAWTRLQAEGRETQHLASFGVRIGRDATFDHLAVNTGASLARWQGFVTIAGTGAEVGFYGAGMLSGRQHGDVKLEVNHAVPHGRSRELYKSVVDGEADGAFQGRIVVKPDAQKTDAKMMTQALLLSDAAEFASKPELEIFADDVQCGHGATAGQIDETMLFYLLSRGIPRGEAERLLIEAFLADPIDAIGDEALGDALKATIGSWLASRTRNLEAS